MDHDAMVRYLTGELRLAPADVDRIVGAFIAALEAHDDDAEIDVGALVRRIIEQTMLPRGQVERTIEAMLELQTKLDRALGAEDAHE